MNRVKLAKPQPMSQAELFYHTLLEHTHDGYGLSAELLLIKLQMAGFKGITARDLRTFNERWNNFRYLDVIPTYKIYKIKSNRGSNALYRRVDMNSRYKSKVDNSAKYDFLCAIADYKNHLRILGDVNTFNSMTIEELMEEANE